MQGQIELMIQILIGWMGIYAISKILKIEERLPWINIGPLYLTVRSDKLNRFLESWSIRHKDKLRIMLNIGVLIGYVLMGAAFYLLLTSLLSFFATHGQTPTAKLLVPGITISFETLLKMLPAIILLLFTHEIAHKIAMHVNNVPIKNVGLLIFYVIPGAFVEPDEEKFFEMPPKVRMQVLAAGTFVNIIVGLLFAPIVLNSALYFAMISPFYGEPSGVMVTQILPNTTLANQSYISVGDVIIAINNVTIKDYSSLLKNRLTPGEEVIVRYIDRDTGLIREIALVPGSDPYNSSRGILGFIPSTYFPPKYSFLDPQWPITFYEVIFWIFFLGVNVAIFNMMPIIMLDGYGHLEALLEYIGLSKTYRKIIITVMFTIALILIGLNVAGDFIRELVFR